MRHVSTEWWAPRRPAEPSVTVTGTSGDSAEPDADRTLVSLRIQLTDHHARGNLPGSGV